MAGVEAEVLQRFSHPILFVVKQYPTKSANKQHNIAFVSFDQKPIGKVPCLYSLISPFMDG